MFVVQANSHFEVFPSRSIERTLSGLSRRSVPRCSHLELLYLANYVTGTCIHNASLLDHTDGRVSIRVKDYKSGHVQKVSFEAEEFVRRFVLHILPPGLRRMRYSGLFTPAGLEQRLELARLLIARQRDGSAAECEPKLVETSGECSTESYVTDAGSNESGYYRSRCRAPVQTSCV